VNLTLFGQCGTPAIARGNSCDTPKSVRHAALPVGVKAAAINCAIAPEYHDVMAAHGG
jgi:hypothetical protein